MSYEEVDRWSGIVAVVAAPAAAVGRFWAVFLWDPVTNAYIANIPTIVQGGKGGARVYAENPSVSVSARYSITAAVWDPDGTPVTINFPVGSDAIGGTFNIAGQVWMGNGSEIMPPESRIQPSGAYLVWAFEFTALKLGSYTMEVVLFAEPA